MNKFKTKRVILALLILGVSIGFAALTTRLSIFGGLNVGANEWDVHWENIEYSDDYDDSYYYFEESPRISDDGDVVSFKMRFYKPGQKFMFTVDAVNNGTLDAKVANKTDLIYFINDWDEIIAKPDYLEYSITYADREPIKNNQLLRSYDSEKYLVSISYSGDSILDYEENLRFELNLDYVVDDGTGIEIGEDDDSICMNNRKRYDDFKNGDYICKRAVVLHQEECTNDTEYGCGGAGYSEDGYQGKTTITYGSCRESDYSDEMYVGDAFDCDVNNNGFVDEDERFYYVTTNDEGYAVLVYYKDLSYNSYNSLGYNYQGPVTLYESLPSIKQWSSEKLYTNITRQILDSSGDTSFEDDGHNYSLPEFKYNYRAARLLSLQDIEEACYLRDGAYNPGILTNGCQFLLENTRFASGSGSEVWWLENPYSPSGNNAESNLKEPYRYYSEMFHGEFVLGVSGDYSSVVVDRAVVPNGVRPAIEVPRDLIYTW